MAVTPISRDLTPRAAPLDRRDIEASPIGLSGWAAIIALLAAAYIALAHVDIESQGARSISIDAFMRLLGFGY